MDPFSTPGVFSWSELMTHDPESAAGFYRQLFGWHIEPMDMGTGPYHVVKAGDVSVAGIMKMPASAPAIPPSWSCYVTVASVDETATRCTALGGKVLVGPQDIPTVGRFAVIQDPQGAVLNVITYARRE